MKPVDVLIEVFVAVVLGIAFLLAMEYGYLDRFFENRLTYAFGAAMAALAVLVYLADFFRFLALFRKWWIYVDMITILGLLGTVMGISMGIYAIDFKAVIDGHAVSSLETFKRHVVFGVDTTIIGVVLSLILIAIKNWREYRGYLKG